MPQSNSPQVFKLKDRLSLANSPTAALSYIVATMGIGGFITPIAAKSHFNQAEIPNFP